MDTELESKPDISTTYANSETEELSAGPRARLTSEDNIIIQDIISNFEEGWIEKELSQPHNGVQIREKRVWLKVADEFNKRQGKRISADQLRRRYKCNKSTYKKKITEDNPQDGDVIDFIKSKLQHSIDPEFLSMSKSKLSNMRAEHFLLKSNLEPVSVWSALLIQALRDLIQARYLVEDGLLMLKTKTHLVKNDEHLIEKEEVKDIDVSEELNIKNSSISNMELVDDQDLLSIKALHNAIDKVLEGIKKYAYIEKFLELSIENEEEITICRYSNNGNIELENEYFKDSLHISSDDAGGTVEHLPNLDLKEDVSDDEDWDPVKNEFKLNFDQDLEETNTPKPGKRKKSANSKLGKARGKRRKFEDGVAVITCEHCGEVCNTKRKFYNHMRKHLQDNAIICKVCNKGFQYKSQYELHFRKHTGERPYRCHVCAAGFTQKNVLVDHLRTHSGEKPFKCDICFLEFTQRSNLKSHMTIHSGEKPFKCDKCTKTFRLKDSLREHESLHTGVKAFKCDQCLKEFRVKGKLRKHLRKQHNITVFPKESD